MRHFFFAILISFTAQLSAYSAPPSPCTIKSFHGKFVCSGPGPTWEFIANRDAGNEWETFIFIQKPDNKFAILTYHGKYLGIDANGKVESHHDNPRDVFSIEQIQANTYAIKAKNNKYIAVEQNGTLVANRDRVGPWETLTINAASQDNQKKARVNALKQGVLDKIKAKINEGLEGVGKGNEGKAYVERLEFDESTMTIRGKIYIRHRQHWKQEVRNPVTGRKETIAEGDTYDHTQTADFYYNILTNQGDAILDLSVSLAGNRIPITFRASDLIQMLIS